MAQAQGRELIGQMLIKKGAITQAQLEQGLETQKQTTQRIGEVLVDLGHVDSAILYQTLSEQLNARYVDLSKFAVDNDVVLLVPRDMCERHDAIAIARGQGTLIMAMADPTDVIALDDLKMRAQQAIEPVLAEGAKIHAAIERVFGSATADAGAGGQQDGQMGAWLEQVRESRSLGVEDTAEDTSERQQDFDKVEELTEEAPIIKMTKVIIQQAIKERSSDFHVEPEQRNVRIRYRIDGVLHEIMKVPKYVHAPLISRLKIMSDMNIAERRVPQDGRIHIRHQKKDYDLRASVIPTTLGEKFVARILDKTSIQIGLEKLGLMPDMQARLESLIIQPNGMLLWTGPTGSGKTTSQYAVLNKINSIEKNIITIEDPVEYQLDGISQVHVNRKAGLTFAIALKYFLRQDPDIIMVGEIRDLETSEIAIQAALTGHLVLSTLHTNDAPSTVTRMVDMGVEPFLISASVIGCMAQRLARKVCDNCREPYDPPRDQLLGLGFDVDAPENRDTVFYHGVGCDQCRQSGYYGRIGIFELMQMNQEIAELVVKHASQADIKEAALAAGMKTLQADGLDKIIDGVTTAEEIARVIFTAGF